MARYMVRYVHKISPRDTDVAGPFEIPDGAFLNCNALGKALRDARIMIGGARVRDFRVEGDNVMAFPSCPGLTTYWHAIILTKEGV